MKTHYVLLIIGMLSTCLKGDQLQYDNHYFLVMNAALTVPHAGNDMGFLKTNSEALCYLERAAFRADGISSSVRLSVTLSALKAATRYTKAVGNTPGNLMEFNTSSNCSLFLSLLDESSKTLRQIPMPIAYLNVDAPGVPASGMDPAGIKDLKVREAYERRIAENRQNSELAILHYQIEQGIDELKRSVHNVIIGARPHKWGSP